MRKTLPFTLLVVALAGCAELAVKHPVRVFLARVELKELVGFVAGLGTTLAALPDLLAMLKRRSSEGMNPRMAAITAVFQLVWLYYGLLILSRPVIVWNTIAVGINSLNVAAYFHFARRRKSERRQGVSAMPARAARRTQ
ncbi:MAG TPA: SemiSWEET family transporter [Candidatus Sulfotelmatobacter sp.]|nr:SemiSWEET family transporter [Candidatus Sulfotelmatobacter sp.]